MKNKFLNKLKQEQKLQLIECSDNIHQSYTEKSLNCLKSAKILQQNNLHENSISMSYYAMYNQLLALLFRIGIKSENHTGSILLLKSLLQEKTLYNTIFNAKQERIDKQYYINSSKDNITEDAAKELLQQAENFILEIKLLTENLNSEKINELRNNFGEL